MTPISRSGLWKKRLGDWVVNPYVGCEHGCFHCYCPAMPGVKFQNNHHTQEQWGSYLLPKAGIVEALAKQLVRFTPERAKTTEWGDGWILLSFLTDCYTPSEAKFKLTRQCLQLLLEAGHRVRIQTRSALVERDFDLMVAHKDQVLLGTSLPYLDDALARTLEPRAPSPKRRLRMLQNAREKGLEVYVAVAPFMPFHGTETMEEVMEVVRPFEPREIFCEVLNPKGSNLTMMHRALAGTYPDLAGRLGAYNADSWAHFTWRMLSLGLSLDHRFVPWPDTQRFWRAYLNPEQARFLETYLPPKGNQEESISA